MFRHSLRSLTNSKIENALKAQISTSSGTYQRWDLLAAVCVERKPLITPTLNEVEKEYKQYLSEVEIERSLKCDHELKHEAEVKQLAALKKGESAEESEVNLQQTAQDFADAGLEELSRVKFASRITEADKQNDVRSVNRKLDKHLVLVLSQKVGEKSHFILPQCGRQDGETLRQTAERILKQNCGPDIKAQIYGNAPCGFYKYKYPKGIQSENGIEGAKVFFYFARYLKGQLPQKGVDFKWLDREELQKTLPPLYSDSVSQFLLDE